MKGTGGAPALFDYELPRERIAQRPILPRDAARLLVVDRSKSDLGQSSFQQLISYLRPFDLLVFNDTRVIPARLFGVFDDTGSRVEILLLESLGGERWRALGKPLKRFAIGRRFSCGERLRVQVVERSSANEIILKLEGVAGESVERLIDELGCAPIPPYIRHGAGDERDLTDYQTIFARHAGSVAAPTASLHFTPELVDQIARIGCGIEYVTLHIGAPSFLPLVREGGEIVPPGKERLSFSARLVEQLHETKERGGRVVAVGTTVVRSLETVVRLEGGGSGGGDLSTDLFIAPGFRFLAVDALITNFHQPGSSHLVLVEALIGRCLLERAYGYALEEQFRFLSYGDGMFVI